MANRKIICGTCRRSYDNTIEYCPYCSTPNPLLTTKLDEEDEDQELSNTAYNQSDDYDDSEYSEEATEEYDENGEYSEDYDDSDYSEDSNYDSDDDEFQASDDEYEYGDNENLSGNDDPTESELQTGDAKRAKIKWTDEEEKKEPNLEDAYNENGEYIPNYDGFYDDTKAKIADETERLTNEVWKTVFKAVAVVAGIIGVIAYLILTM